MSKEQQELLDEAYKNYFIKKSSETGPFGVDGIIPTKDEFIGRVITNPGFDKQWGLKIEERELSLEERIILAGYDYENRGGIGWNILKESVYLDNSIPRKLITITYNDKTIKSYE